LNDRKIIGCRKNILSIFVALLTFYNKEKKEESITLHAFYANLCSIKGS
jgi:hypothetical protein